MITQEYLLKHFIYDPEVGQFINRIGRGRSLIGEHAGTIHPYGYRQIQILGYIYKEHRLAWLYVYGDMPEEIDHKNGNRSDNRISNLRVVTRSQNNANSERPTGTAGLRGVTWFDRDQKWKAQIKVGGRSKHLGYFDTVEEAHAVYLTAAEYHFGEHAYHNRQTQEL